MFEVWQTAMGLPVMALLAGYCPAPPTATTKGMLRPAAHLVHNGRHIQPSIRCHQVLHTLELGVLGVAAHRLGDAVIKCQVVLNH